MPIQFDLIMKGFNIGILLIVFVQLLLVSGTGNLQAPMTWDKAYDHCKAERKIVSPNSSPYDHITVYNQGRTLWTSNYMLHLGCVNNTDDCPILYVEQVPINEPHKGLCDRNKMIQNGVSRNIEVDTLKPFNKACKIPEGNYGLLSIKSMTDLHKIPTYMTSETKYWIQDIPELFHTSFVRHCEVFNKFKNTSNQTQSRILRLDCDTNATFLCVSGQEYHTVVSIIQLDYKTQDVEDRLAWTTQQTVSTKGDGCPIIHIHALAIEASTGLIFIVLLLLACLSRRWITKMKKDIMEHLNEKLVHHIRHVKERVRANMDEKPTTTISMSSRVSSMYDDAYSAKVANNICRISNQMESQTTLKRTQNEVTTTETNHIDYRPPQALPERTGNDVIKRSPGIRRPGLKTNEAHSGHLSSTTSLKSFCCTHEEDSGLSSGCQGTGICNSSKTLEMHSLEKEPKPSPKPNTKFSLVPTAGQSDGNGSIRFVDVENGIADEMYVNTGEQTEKVDIKVATRDEIYENIWKK